MIEQIWMGIVFLYVSGEPGAGKSEVLIHAAVRAASAGCQVLILCPTGALVHGYRDRLPESEHIVVETIHSAFCIYREQDLVVQYSPPTRLRRYDLIILDEASQVEDGITEKLTLAILELPQRPFVCVTADYAQLAPVSGGGKMRSYCEGMRTVCLRSIFRTSDPVLLSFLGECRVKQPEKNVLRSFFARRELGNDLVSAVRYGLEYGREHSVLFSWLCVTNAGADRVNKAALELLGIDDSNENLLYGDPKVSAGRIKVATGVLLRLTRNLDKARGFVNGAIGEVATILNDSSFIVRLSSGTLQLVHPISVGGRQVLPCCYGYATTIRKAQGATLHAGCLFFDHKYPAERGYGYVGASRFKSKDGLFYFGRIRRSDWLPRQVSEGQQEHRSFDSESEDDEERELEANYESSAEDSDDGELQRLCMGCGRESASDEGGGSSDESGEDNAPMRSMLARESGRGDGKYKDDACLGSSGQEEGSSSGDNDEHDASFGRLCSRDDIAAVENPHLRSLSR